MMNTISINPNIEERIKFIGGEYITIGNKGPGAVFISDDPNIISGKLGVRCIAPNSIGTIHSFNKNYEFVKELGKFEYVSYMYVKTEKDKEVNIVYDTSENMSVSEILSTESMGIEDSFREQQNGDYNDLLKALSKACAEICRNNWRYSQTIRVNYNIDGKEYISRCDCSGMVTAAMMSLDLVNKLYTAANFSGGRFKNVLKPYGYTFFKKSDVPEKYWASLPIGTIMAYNKHVEVCAGWSGDNVLLYTAGSDPFKINDIESENAFRENYNWSEGKDSVSPYKANYGMDYIKSTYTGFYIPDVYDDSEIIDDDNLDLNPQCVIKDNSYVVYPVAIKEGNEYKLVEHEVNIGEYIKDGVIETTSIVANKLYHSSKWAVYSEDIGIAEYNNRKIFHSMTTIFLMHYIDELDKWIIMERTSPGSYKFFRACKPSSLKKVIVDKNINSLDTEVINGDILASFPDNGYFNLYYCLVPRESMIGLKFDNGHIIDESDSQTNMYVDSKYGHIMVSSNSNLKFQIMRYQPGERSNSNNIVNILDPNPEIDFYW